MIILASTVVVSIAHAETTDQGSLNRSNKAFQSGDYRGVLKILEKNNTVDGKILKARSMEIINSSVTYRFYDLLDTLTNETKAMCWCAHAHINGRDYRRAEEILTAQLATVPNSGLVHTMLGDCYSRSGRNQLALKEFLIAKKIEPSSEILFDFMSDHYLKNLQASEAINVLTAWSLAHPLSARSYAKKANIYIELGQLDNALEQCKKAISVGTKYQLAQLLLAQIDYDQKKYPLAIEVAQKSLSLDSESDDAQNAKKLLAHCFEEQKDYANEIAYLDQLLAKRHSQGFPIAGWQIDSLLARGQALLNLGKPKEALADADEVLQTMPNTSSARLLRARALSKAGLYTKSYEEYSRLTKNPFAPSYVLQEKNDVLQIMGKKPPVKKDQI